MNLAAHTFAEFNEITIMTTVRQIWFVVLWNPSKMIRVVSLADNASALRSMNQIVMYFLSGTAGVVKIMSNLHYSLKKPGHPSIWSPVSIVATAMRAGSFQETE